MGDWHRIGHDERGYAMAALIVMLGVMAVAMTVAMPAWSTLAQRERETELAFRGEQWARAITLFQRKYAGAYPPNLDVLVTERFIRKRYKDPITGDDFQPVRLGEATEAIAQAERLRAQQSGTGRTGTAGRGTGTGGVTQERTQQGRAAGPGTFGAVGGQVASQARGTGAGQVGATTGILGVTSRSDAKSLRNYFGAEQYNQWLFVATQATTQAGGQGGPAAGAPGGGIAPAPRQPGPNRPGAPQRGGPPGGRGSPFGF